MFALALVAIASGACASQSADEDYCRWVDPKIGSGEFGHVFVGADVPFGAVQLGPISVKADWDLCSGYHSTADSTCIGFSHTRLGGSGMRDLCDVTLMPVIGEDFEYARGSESDPHSGMWSYADRSREISEPGYYSVPLKRYGILGEVTSGNRVGYSRFTFPASGEAAIVIDLENGSGQGDETTGVELRAVSDRKVVGRRSSMGWSDRGWDVADNEKIWFVAEFSKPFDRFELKGNGMYGRADFTTADGEQILVRVGISPVSVENAELNLASEDWGWDFDKVRSDAREAWNKELGKIRIKTSSERTKRIFYTALYHSTQFPSVFSDVNGGYYGGDGHYYTADGFTYYTNLSLWDTYRAQMPLLSILEADRQNDYANTFIQSFYHNGRVPVWMLFGVETDCMISNPGIPVLADIVMKGYKGFDVSEAYRAMKESAMLPGRWQDLRMQYKYIPFDLHEMQSVAYDCEYAIADWAVAQVAKKLLEDGGSAFDDVTLKKDYEYFMDRSTWYREHYDPESGFARGKDSKGCWREPFNPFYSNHMHDDYCEGTAWQYTWLAPHDIQGLVDLFGSKEAFVEKLDRLFSEPSRVDGDRPSPDISGMIGQYVHGNEPCHPMIYYYTMVGEPRRTAELVRHTLTELYGDGTEGLCGNDDMGEMSAWYILSALGFFQSEPCGGRYWFGSPLVDEAVITLDNGKTFTVRTINNSDANKYIESVTLNGKPYDRLYIEYSDIMAGGELTFTMGS